MSAKRPKVVAKQMPVKFAEIRDSAVKRGGKLKQNNSKRALFADAKGKMAPVWGVSIPSTPVSGKKYDALSSPIDRSRSAHRA